MKVRFDSFALWLPVLEMAAWLLLVLLPVYGSYRGLQRIHAGPFGAYVHERSLTQTLEGIAASRGEAIMALEFPGEIVDIAISLPTSWPHTWHPTGLSALAWRTISLPFFCLPAWWLVGRGIDGFTLRRRLHGALVMLSLLLCLACVTIAAGFQLTISDSERAEFAWIIPGLVCWSVAFAAAPAAWLRFRLDRRPITSYDAT